jgi:hypothetical protein
MKKQIFFFLLLIFSGAAFGQSLVETNKIWHVTEFINFGPGFTAAYTFEGDSVINDFTYKKLWKTDDSTYSNWYFQGLMREDLSGKVFSYTPDGEELMYDFGLLKNDVFNGVVGGCPVELTVDSIDMITLENGELRKRWIFNSSSSHHEEWIEGIGSMFGITNVGSEQCWIDLWFELNCFAENDTLKYDNPTFDPCFYTTVCIAEAVLVPDFVISPNPIHAGIITIDNIVQNCKYQIFNIFGVKVKTGTIGAEANQIAVHELSAGSYILKIEDAAHPDKAFVLKLVVGN